MRMIAEMFGYLSAVVCIIVVIVIVSISATIHNFSNPKNDD
jgi:hypothetical protein